MAPAYSSNSVVMIIPSRINSVKTYMKDNTVPIKRAIVGRWKTGKNIVQILHVLCYNIWRIWYN